MISFGFGPIATLNIKGAGRVISTPLCIISILCCLITQPTVSSRNIPYFITTAHLRGNICKAGFSE